jgi:hypothetical protein
MPTAMDIIRGTNTSSMGTTPSTPPTAMNLIKSYAPSKTQPQKAQATLSKPTLLQTIGNTFSNIVKGLTLSFKAPAVSKPLPESTFQKIQPTQQKMISITPNQKKLTPLQLDTIQPTSAQLTPQAKKGTQQRTEALGKKVTNILPTTTEAIKQLLADPASLKANPTKIINDVVTSLKEPFMQEKQRIKDLFTAKTPSQKVGKGLEAVSGGANVLFSPLSAFFSAANDIPVLGTASKLITIAIGAVGEGATKLSDKIVDTLPLSSQVKKDIKVGVGEIAALAAQIAIGKIVEVGFEKKAELVKRFGEKDANVIIEKATELAQEKKGIATENKLSTKIIDTLGEGEHTPEEIVGKVMANNFEKTPEGKALIKAAGEAQKTGQNIVITAEQPKNFTPLEQPQVKEAQPTEIKPKTVNIAEEAKTPSKIAVSIEQKAVEQGLTKGFEGVSGYDKITIKEQAKMATDLLNSDIEKARRIITGEEELPKGLKGTALITAMEEHIKNTKNSDLAYELANSPLVSGTSAAAQEMRLAAERTPDSLTKKLMEVKQAKEEAFKKKYGDKTVKEATDTVVKNIKEKVKVPDRYDWGKFINSIQC